MLKNYLKIAFRNILRNKLYSFINISGLALGLAVAILIGLWIQNELSFDRYFQNADRIYRVTTHFKIGEFDNNLAVSSPPIAGALRQIPGVESAASFSTQYSNVVIGNRSRRFVVDNVVYADSAFFSVFSLRLMEGNRSNALDAPNTVVLTTEAARLLFPNSDPIGRTVDIRLNGNERRYEVTGVMQNVPENTHFHFKVLVSLSTFYLNNPEYKDKWYYGTNYNYFVLKPGASLPTIKSDLSADILQNIGENFVRQNSWSVGFQKIVDLHLHSHLSMEIEPNSSVHILLIYLAVGLFVLFIAIVNFVTLSIAGFSHRTKEIGVRKAIGANRNNVIFQFTGEAVIMTLLSSVVALSIAELALPYCII